VTDAVRSDAPLAPPPTLWLGPHPARAAAVTVLLHGRGRSAAEMIDLATRLDLSGMCFIALAAPGGTWYPQSFLAPIEENQPSLDAALDRIGRTVAELERMGHRRERVALAGFSQGACLASEYVFRRPSRWGALVALTGGIVGPLDVQRVPSGRLDGTPALFATADPDPWVPLARVRDTAGIFRSMGADVDLRVYPGADHAISDDAIGATRTLLARLLRAGTS
jgi:phospholipase/carboxylesterase